MLKLAALFIASVAAALAQTTIDYNTQIRNKPITTGPTVPTSCTIPGNIFLQTGTNILYVCDGAHYFLPSTINSGAVTPTTCSTSGTLFWNTASMQLFICNGRSYQLPASQPANAFDYIWTRSPGGSLTGGATTSIALTPCPNGLGVNGFGIPSKYYVYIAGTGSPEAMLVTGFGYSPTSCTIIGMPANSHPAGFTVGTATVGIAEAESSLMGRPGKIYMPAGNYALKAAVPYLPNMTFEGDGVGTKLYPASCSATVFDANLPVHSSSQYFIVKDNVSFRHFLIEGSETCPGINTIFGIRELNLSSSTEVWSQIGVKIEDVFFDNVRYAVYFHRSADTQLLSVNLYENSTINFTDSVIKTAYPSGGILINNLHYDWNPIVGNNTQQTNPEAIIACYWCEVFNMTDSVLSGRPIVNIPAVLFAGGEDIQISQTDFETFYYGAHFAPITFADTGATSYPGYITLNGLVVDQIWGSALFIENGVDGVGDHKVSHLEIVNSNFTNPNTTLTVPILLNLGNFTSNVSISNTLFGGLGNAGEYGLRIGTGSDNIRLGSTNLFTNDSTIGTGIIVDAPATNVFGLEAQTCIHFTTCVTDLGTVDSVATMTLPSGRKQVTVLGLITVTSITAQATGTTVTLLVPLGLTITDGGNLKLAGNFVGSGTAICALTIYSDGTNWYEVSRSIN